MKLNPQELEKIASLTLDHYNERAEDFWQGTRDHDVKQNIAALFQWIEGKPGPVATSRYFLNSVT